MQIELKFHSTKKKLSVGRLWARVFIFMLSLSILSINLLLLIYKLHTDYSKWILAAVL